MDKAVRKNLLKNTSFIQVFKKKLLIYYGKVVFLQVNLE